MELFVRPAIESMRGLQPPAEKQWQKAPLAADFSWKGDRPFYPPMRLDSKGLLHPTHLSGSADLRSIAGCNVLARLAPQGMLHAGDPVDIAILE
jgi:molybdopterin biosynthesis enzyme